LDYFIADPHFDHENIVKYCGRPFKDAAEMNALIIDNWNRVVTPKDRVFVLGDFSFGNKDMIAKVIGMLNGNKILVKGNHDNRTITFWKRRGMMAYKNPIYYNRGEFVLSHEPVLFPPIPNIHGHTHGNLHRGSFHAHGIHVCVSAEVVNYTPISITEVREKVKAIKAEEDYG
jgi:calcineurin-like phosphoesterase family protein